MKEIGRPAFGFLPDVLSGSDVAELAKGVERLGYDMLRYAERNDCETLNYSGFVLVGIDRLGGADSIVNIHVYDALTAVSGHDSLSNFYGDRFIPGLGCCSARRFDADRRSTCKPANMSWNWDTLVWMRCRPAMPRTD